MKRVGMLTIGQSPRTDVAPIIQSVSGESVEMIQRGALDSLSDSEIKALWPNEGDTTYIYRLRNGQSTKIKKEALLPLLQRELTQLEEEVSVVLLLCTGDFPTIQSEKLLLFPDKILVKVMSAVLREGKLGLIVPLEEQKGQLMEKWHEISVPIVVEAASPYEESDIESAADSLKNQGATVIVLDCMGYDESHKERAMQATNLPIVLSISLAASVLKEYI